MRQRVHVIGTGSPFGDDRLGWAAAEVLRDSLALDGDWIEVSKLDRPGALLPLHWQGADAVILLDAVCSGATPGTRHRLAACDLPDAHVLCSSHGFGIASAIRLAQALGDLPSRLLLCGVEADPAWTGAGLSPAVTAALPSFVTDIAEEARLLAGFHAPAAANRA